jgi:hypothetical protein
MGLSHSEISGSKRICRSPKLIAAYHVLHRLLAPRHSSCALSSLSIPRFKKISGSLIYLDSSPAELTAAVTALQTQHFEVAIYFALYADVKEPSGAFASGPVPETGFSNSNNRENSKRELS